MKKEQLLLGAAFIVCGLLAVGPAHASPDDFDGMSDEDILAGRFSDVSTCELLDVYDDVEDDLDDHEYFGDGSEKHIHDLKRMLDRLDNELEHRATHGFIFPCGGYAFAQAAGLFSSSNHLLSNDIFGADGSNASLGSGYMFGLGAGAPIVRGLNAEATFGYYGGLGLDFSPDKTLSLKNNAHSYTALFNLRAFPSQLIPATKPYTSYPGSSSFPRTDLYIEAGGGFSINSFGGTTLSNGTTIGDNTNVSGAYDVGLGVKLDLAPVKLPKTFIDIGYRYTSLGTFNSGDRQNFGASSTPVSPISTSVGVHQALVQVGYKF